MLSNKYESTENTTRKLLSLMLLVGKKAGLFLPVTLLMSLRLAA